VEGLAMTATTRFWAGAAGAAAATALLAGCAQDDAADAPLVAPVSVERDTGPFAGTSGADVMARATRAMDGIVAVTVDIRFDAGSDGSGGSDDPEDGPSRLAAAVEYGKCAGSMEFDARKVQFLLVSGTRYLKGDAGFWTTEVGAPPAIGQELSGSWVKLPPPGSDGDGDTGLEHFCDLQGMLNQIDDAAGEGPVTKGSATTYDGHAVIPLTQDGGDVTTRYYVATAGTPYILRLDDTEDGDTTTVGFSDFDKKPRITAPPAGSTLDLSDYTHDPGFTV
jgi:hypothetical protein